MVFGKTIFTVYNRFPSSFLQELLAQLLIVLAGGMCIWGFLQPTEAFGQRLSIASDLIVEQTVEPGAEYEDEVLLRNNTGEALTVTIEKRDFHFSFDGGRSFLDPGTLHRSNAGWITVSSNVVSVPPDTVIGIEYNVRVPNEPSPGASGTAPAGADPAGTDPSGTDPLGAQASEAEPSGAAPSGTAPSGGALEAEPSSPQDSLTGTYWSVLMVEKGDATTRQSSSRIQITENFRYAVQIATHIGTSGKRSVDLRSARIDTIEGEQHLVVDLAHNGTRSFEPEVYLELYDESGSPVGKFDAGSRLIYPSTSARLTTSLAGVDSGSYSGMLVIDGGEGALFGAQMDFQL